MSYKQDRVAERIRIILMTLLVREVADPRLEGITVTKVELDPEWTVAKVWVNALGEEDRQAEVLEGLRHAKGFLRREVGQRVRLRSTPDLVFRWDASLERSERIHAVLNSLHIPPPEANDDNNSNPPMG